MAQLTAIGAAAAKVDVQIVVLRGTRRASGGSGKGGLVRQVVEGLKQRRSRSLHAFAGERRRRTLRRLWREARIAVANERWVVATARGNASCLIPFPSLGEGVRDSTTLDTASGERCSFAITTGRLELIQCHKQRDNQRHHVSHLDVPRY
jgi:hypothetical protein